MIAQYVEQLDLGRTVHGNGDTVAFAHAQTHNLHGAGQVGTAGAHFQGAGGVGIALGQLGQTACGAQKHGKFILQSVRESHHNSITS